MSRYAQFDEDGNQYQVASNRGWSEFGDWVETLSKKTYPQLHELWNDGSSQLFEEVIKQLGDALENHPPSKNVAGSTKLLLNALRKNKKKAHTLLITG